MTTTLIPYISICALRGLGALSVSSNNFERNIFFFWAVSLNSRLKIFRKPCLKWICCHPGFVISFILHSRVALVQLLRVLRCVRMVTEHWLNLKSLHFTDRATSSAPLESLLTIRACTGYLTRVHFQCSRPTSTSIILSGQSTGAKGKVIASFVNILKLRFFF